MRKYRIFSMGLAFYIFIFVFCAFAQEKIIAVVNNDVITQKDMDSFLNFTRVQLSQEYEGQELENKLKSMEVDLLNKLIEDRLILQEAKKNGVKVDAARVKARLDEIIKRYGSENEFQLALSQQGLTRSDIEARIAEQFLTYSIVEGKVRSKIIVSPSEVTEFYQNHLKEFMLPESREFELIALEGQAQANEISAKLKKQESLEDLASQYSVSINQISAVKNGELRQDIEETVFKLKKGQASYPIELDGKFYIFKLNGIAPPRTQTLSEAQDRIYGFLYEVKLARELTKWLDELKDQSYIKIL